jgi:delta-aminolevulinic acid dehydratase/porphobilinogen synthase
MIHQRCFGKMAVSHAQAGADFVAPSDMMDVVITARLRQGLDAAGFPGGVGTYLFCQICWHFTDRFVL